ncbi:MAG: response regulator transcription factor [Planctomycetota bacterium]
MQNEPIRLILVDDHAVMRSGLANMLNARSDFVVVAEFETGEDAVRDFQTHAGDIILLDVMLSGMDGIACLQQIRRINKDIAVLMLSSSKKEHDMFRAMEAGANGYIAKSAQPETLMQAIRTVSLGSIYLENGIRSRLQVYQASQLTPREGEVLALLRHGKTNQEIGETLGISGRTAKAHVAAIMLKFEARDRVEAVTRGFELGLLRS